MINRLNRTIIGLKSVLAPPSGIPRCSFESNYYRIEIDYPAFAQSKQDEFESNYYRIEMFTKNYKVSKKYQFESNYYRIEMKFSYTLFELLNSLNRTIIGLKSGTCSYYPVDCAV